jgi:hypothetical protein
VFALTTSANIDEFFTNPVEKTTVSPPEQAQSIASITAGGDPYIFMLGFYGEVYVKSWKGTLWSGWVDLGGDYTSIAAVAADGIPEVCAFNSSGVYNTYYISFWSSWSQVGAISGTSAISVTALRNGDPFVFDLAAGMIYVNWVSGSTWQGWHDLG